MRTLSAPSAETQAMPGPRALEKGAAKAAGGSMGTLRSVVLSAVRSASAAYRRRCFALACACQKSMDFQGVSPLPHTFKVSPHRPVNERCLPVAHNLSWSILMQDRATLRL